MYKRHGVVGLFMEGAVSKGGGAENAELRSYVMAKLLWDIKADANQLVNEFLILSARRPGPCAPTST